MRQIEALYPLTPQQRGLYFSSLAAGDGGAHVDQFIFSLRGRLDADRLVESWRQVFQRHPVLRSAFVMTESSDPLQVVVASAELPITAARWSVAGDGARGPLAELLSEDRQGGFDLATAPLARLALVTLADGTHRLVWTVHHLITDGWSMPRLLGEVFEYYGGDAGSGCAADPPPPFKAYVDWVRSRPDGPAREFWNRRLAGLALPTPLGRSAPAEDPLPEGRGFEEVQIQISSALSLSLQEMASRHRVTLSTVVEGAWAALLSRYSGDQRVVFGTTVCGRPADLPGAERIVGPLAGTLPCTAAVDPSSAPWRWLEDLQAERLALEPFAYCSTGQIHEWIGLAGSRPLFDSVVVFENYPAELGRFAASGLQVEPGATDFVAARSGYPLTLLVVPGAAMWIRAVFDSARLSPGDVQRMLRHVHGLLESFLEAESATLGDLLDAVPEPELPTLRPVPRRSRPPADRRAGTLPWTEPVAAVCREVLDLDRLEPDDDLFQLGAHSLVAARIGSRLRDLLGKELPLRTVFENPTVASLAAALEDLGSGDDRRPLESRGATRAGRWPASASQRRLWFLGRLYGDAPLYNVPAALQLTGPLNADLLERSIQSVIERHEALRTSFQAEGSGELVQVVSPGDPVSLARVDRRGLDARERRADIERRARDLVSSPFDLRRPPLVRAELIAYGPEEHALLVVAHHIVLDAESRRIFFREMVATYEAAIAGRPSPLPEPWLQFGDFASWQREWLESPAAAAELEYWRGALRGMPMVKLTPDFTRPAMPTFRGGREEVRLPAGVVRELRRLARARGASLFMVLLAAFKVLLWRYTGETDVSLGTPVANRDRREVEQVIGFFLNSLVLRTSLDGDPSFAELIDRVRATTLGAFDHQTLPFERLVEDLRPERSANHNPLFQMSFALQDQPPTSAWLGDVRIDRVDIDVGFVRLDLEVNLFEEGDELRCSMLYSRDLFEAPTLARMAAQYLRLLEQAAEAPRSPLSRLSLLSPAARRQVVEDWNRTAARLPAGDSLVSLFRRQAEARPHAIALSGAGRSVSYGELRRRAHRLGRRLRRLRVGRQEPVALCLSRGPELVAGLLGILEAGACCVPLDPRHPAQRLRTLLEESGARTVVTEPSLMEPEILEGRTVVRLAEAFDAVLGGPEEELEPAAGGHEIAVVDFTSGSTGRPKAVALSHRNVVSLVCGCRAMRHSEETATLQLASIGFDVALYEIFAPLLHGGRCACFLWDVPQESTLRGAIDESRVNTLVLTATLYHSLIDGSAAALQGLDQLVVCGEVLSVPHVVRGLEALPNTRILSGYAPTECTTFSNYFAVPAGFSERRRTIPLGPPKSHMRAFVLGPSGEASPPGVPGELLLGGLGVTLGYLKQPARTAERFIPDPFGRAPGERLYRTGDLCRWLPSGDVDFLGRIDRQVKIRGHRIEPGEVESALLQHEEVSAAAVLVDGEGADKRLLAYLVVTDSGERGTGTEADRERRLREWQAWYDRTYSSPRPTPSDPWFNVTGWRSSLDGRRIGDDEMREWLDETVEAIRGLRPNRVLEIGCGTGLVLFRLINRVRRYRALDLSQAAVDYVSRHLPAGAPAEVTQGTADRLEVLGDERFDTVILNSVATYFPSREYLTDVLEQALDRVEAGGAVFVGDVRNLELAPHYHAALQLLQAPPGTPAGELIRRMERQRAEDGELLLAPRYFAALKALFPRIRDVEIRIKAGRHRNEMNLFRYDVVLHVGAEATQELAGGLVWGVDLASLQDLETLLERNGAPILLERVPDRRLSESVGALERLRAAGGQGMTVDELRRELLGADEGVEPAELRELAEARGHRVRFHAAPGAPGTFRALLWRGDTPLRREPIPALDLGPPPSQEALASDPLRAARRSRVLEELQASVAQALPAPLRPAAYVVLDRIPVNAHGKLDRAALRAPAHNLDRPRVEPRTETEEALIAIWQSVLDTDGLSVTDDFFELGGHSLLATQILDRIGAAFGVELPLLELFENPTVAGLAAALDQIRTEPVDELPPLRRVARVPAVGGPA